MKNEKDINGNANSFIDRKELSPSRLSKRNIETNLKMFKASLQLSLRA